MDSVDSKFKDLPQWVSVYAKEITEHLKKQENSDYPSYDLMKI